MIPLLPPGETERLAALRSYAVLDTPAEPAFDDLVRLAAHICGTPIALISLVDENRQWFKSRLGLAAAETPRDLAFCAHTILHADEVLEVRDTLTDPRFAGSPLVTGDPRIRFYAGAPLVTPAGHALGSLCVIDRTPRTLTPEQVAALRALSRGVVAQLELRRQARALAAEVAERERAEHRLRHQLEQLAASEKETARLLASAEKMRHALLSVLEDEKRAGQNLRESEARFRQLAESIDEVFWITDPTKNAMLYVSPAYEAIWGRTCGSLYASSRSWIESIHEEDRARILEAATTRQALGTYDETYRIVRPDGSQRWVRDRAFPVRDAAGRVIRIVGVAGDITRRKELEEQFLRTQRLEAIGTLSSGIAHDLNNILAPILMVAPLLKAKLAEPGDAELLGMVEQGAMRGANIVRQLLTFSRGIEGSRGPVQVRHLLKEMCALMRETFPREIMIAEDATAGLWPVIADATQLHQVLLNLCVNARDAMPDGGRLALGARNVPPGEVDRLAAGAVLKPGPYVELTVEDTGQGMTPEIAARIFEPFFTTKEVGRGTGLGLSTVLGIVNSHAGRVCVHSQPGKGSRFVVYLPASVDLAEASSLDVAGRMLTGRNELILVVDDEEPIRQVLQRMLEEHGYRVLSAANGKDALGLFVLHRSGVRLLLTDVMMPVMGGVSLIRAARALEPELCVIATSGLHDDERRQELARLGVPDVLAKPFDPRDILDAIHRALHAVR